MLSDPFLNLSIYDTLNKNVCPKPLIEHVYIDDTFKKKKYVQEHLCSTVTKKIARFVILWATSSRIAQSWKFEVRNIVIPKK